MMASQQRWTKEVWRREVRGNRNSEIEEEVQKNKLREEREVSKMGKSVERRCASPFSLFFFLLLIF